MTDAAQNPPRIPALIHSGLLTSLGILLLAIAFWDFRMVQGEPALRTNVLVAEIVAGIAAAICFGGGIHFINAALAGPIPWYFRLPLFAKTRLLMLLQLAAMAIAVAAVGVILFDVKIPGPDLVIPTRAWVPPPTPPQ